MGNPAHYSREIPRRCLQLIDGLWNQAENMFQADRRDLGPLTSTFLISMSFPIINLPIERIERHSSRTGHGYADDRHIDPKMAAAVWEKLGGEELKKAPFYLPGAWSFCKSEVFNISAGLPEKYAERLASPEAHAKASHMPTSQWCSVLRNAMAHGGIAYLNEAGYYTYEAPVSMYLFVSGRYLEGDPKKELIELNLLRISESNYRNFLRSWVKWLQRSGIEEILEAA
jgi:hypothetical protein